jgi:hypothetical protein
MRSIRSRSAAVLLSLSVLLLAGCDSAAPDRVADTRDTAGPTATTPAADGEVLVQLEKIEGFLTEGFRLQIGLEAPPGQQVIESTWDDLVQRQRPKDAPRDYVYRAVIRTPVPAGEFVLSTVMHPGMDSEQPRCVTRGQVDPGGAATVTVKFSVQDGMCATVSTAARS